MSRTIQIVGSIAVIAIVMVLGLAGWGCYPKNCDPKTDPLRCQCPDGACDHYPSAGGLDASGDVGGGR